VEIGTGVGEVKRFIQARIRNRKRRPANAFEALLEKWQRGDEVSWGDLFAAWLKLPTAPKSRETVRKVIRRVEWIG